MKTISLKTSRTTVFVIIGFGLILLLFPRPSINVGIVFVAYALFLMSRSVEVKSVDSGSSVHYSSPFGQKSITSLESVDIIDLFIINSVTFVGNGGTHINITNIKNIKEMKEFARMVNDE